MKQPKRIMREMAAAVLLGQLNIDQAAERYKVNRMTVLRWIRKIEEEAKAKKQAASTDPDLQPPSTRKSTRPSTPEDQVNQLRAKVRSLEAELETANFKTLYYSTLVRVAKHELGVDIEKKPPWPGPLPSHPVHADELWHRPPGPICIFGSWRVCLVSLDKATTNSGNGKPARLIMTKIF